MNPDAAPELELAAPKPVPIKKPVSSKPTPAKPAPRASLRDLWRLEFGLLHGRPLLWAALFVVAFAPTLYAVSYLSSVWDPYGNLSNLPVGLVNGDTGTRFKGEAYDLGADLKKTLLAEKKFNFHEFNTTKAAEAAVNRGEVYFALLIPPAFSHDALSGEFAQKGELTVYAAEGTSYFAATLAKRFGGEAARGVSEKLSQGRWESVLGKLSALRDGFKKLRSGAAQLSDGAARLETATAGLDDGATKLRDGLRQASSGAGQLSAGAQTLSGGVTRLTAGTAKLAGAIRTVAAQTPQDADLERLAAGSQGVKDGSAKLSSGLAQLSLGTARLATSGGQVADGLKTLAANGAKLEAGATQLSAGLTQTQAGGAKLSAGAAQLEAGLKPVPMPPQARQGLGDLASDASDLSGALTPLSLGAQSLLDGQQAFNVGLTRASDGADQLAAGAQTLNSSTAEAGRGAASLSSAAAQVDAGVQRLTGGLKKLNAGLGQMTAQLPTQSNLTALANGATTLANKTAQLSAGLGTLQAGSGRLESGSAQLREGATKLRDGLKTLTAKIPLSLETLPGDAKGLAASVESQTQLTAKVADNGTAFTPYFVVLSLWFGATLTSFVFAFNKLPASTVGARHPAKILAKFTLPGLLVAAQAVLLMLAVRFWLNVPSFGLSSSLIVLVAALAFLSVVTALLSVLGDAGRLIAVILLVVQLGAAGGAYPIELAPPFFQVLHPLLPLANAMKALRAAMFGSYDGAWLGYTAVVLLTGALGWATMLLVGRWRWKPVADEQYVPALEI